MISQYCIDFYESDQNFVVHSSNENSELVKQLWKYHDDLGVNAYQADTENLQETVRWQLMGSWYTTSQIERIYGLRAFL